MSQRPSVPEADEILGLYFPVLDHGFVSLVDYMGSDAAIESAARVSYGHGTRRTSDTRGLLRYLRRHKHTTPTEMVELKFHCAMPMFVARQWVRHRTACLAGDTALWFDLPGAERRGRRQSHRMTIAKFFDLWTRGSSHPIKKKKPLYLDRVDPAGRYTVSELARLVDRREETLRTYIRDGALAAEREPAASPAGPSIFVRGAAWHAYARAAHEARVPMRERLSRMKLRRCVEASGEIGHTRVVDIWQTGVRPVFRVTLDNGYSVKMTKDHRCLTERGWLTLEQATRLKLAGTGAVCWDGNAPALAVNGVAAHRSAEWLAQKRAAGLGVADIAREAGVSYHTVRAALRKCGLSFSAQERAALAGLAQRGQRRASAGPRAITDEHREASRRARGGAASNFWKGGVTSERANIGRWTREHAARTHARGGHRCATCGGRDRLNAHHLDPVWHNPGRARDETNLLSLCGRCHGAVHRLNLELDLLAAAEAGADLRGFWQGRERAPRPEGKRTPAPRRLVRAYARIAKIEFAGHEMTYDLEVEGPDHNFVANGFVVHNSVNEYSGRYSLMPLLFYTPPDEQLMRQSENNRQGRAGDPLAAAERAEVLGRWQRGREHAVATYEQLSTQDVARELARIDLPLSTYTQWYWKIDLHNLLHFLTLRVDTHAQWEIREYARVMAGMVRRVAPISYEAWVDYDLEGTSFSRMELDALRAALRSADPTAALERPKLAETLSKREIEEFFAKLEPRDRPDFVVDPAGAKPASYFAEYFAAAVPEIDRSKPSGA